MTVQTNDVPHASTCALCHGSGYLPRHQPFGIGARCPCNGVQAPRPRTVASVPRRSRTADEIDARHRQRLQKAVRDDIAAFVGSMVAEQGSGPYACLWCHRTRFGDDMALWQHIRDAHKAPSFFAENASSFDDRVEDALVRIVNSTTHDEAIEIATAALTGGD